MKKNLKLQLQNQFEQRIQYVIGFTQLILQQENMAIWICSSLIETMQKTGIVTLSNQMFQLQGIHLAESDFSVFWEVCVPSGLLIESVSVVALILFQVLVIFALATPMTMITKYMIEEYNQFRQSRMKTSKANDSLIDSILIMHQLYNQNSFIEGFQHRLMQDVNNQSMTLVRLKIIAIYLNYFPHIIVIPLVYFILEMFMVANNHSQYAAAIIVLNVIIQIQIISTSFLSLSFIQQSLAINDSNYLRIRSSGLHKLHHMIIIVPVIISFLLINQGAVVDQSMLKQFNLINLLIAFIIDAFDTYVTIPYVNRKKIITQLVCRSFAICYIIFSFLHVDRATVTLIVITWPFLSRIFYYIEIKKVDDIMISTLIAEKKATHEQVHHTLRIENLLIERGESQQQLKKKYFIHFLVIVNQMNLNHIGVLTRNSNVRLDFIRSRLLITIKVLLQRHRECCNNLFCFCRSLTGEKSSMIEKIEQIKEMRMYDDFEQLNVQFYIELVQRYLRDYAKLLFHFQIKERVTINIIQLLFYIAQSDECYQVQLLLLQVKHKVNKSSKLNERMALELLTSQTKFNILNRMKETLTYPQIIKTLQYQDYRITETSKDHLIQVIFKQIRKKEEFLIKLNNQIHTHESLENLLLDIEQLNKAVKLEMQAFSDQQNSRTSTYIEMFYCLELTNDFDRFVRLYNQINTKECKFFEHPQFYFNTEEQSFKVSYLLCNLTQSQIQKRGSIMSYSKNTLELTKYSAIEFDERIRTIDDLLYPSLYKAHDEMLEIFVLTNRPEVFRKPMNLLLQLKTKGLVEFVELFMDICFTLTDNLLPCYTFIKSIKILDQEVIKGHILVNANLQVEGVTQLALNLFETTLDQFYMKDICQILDEFANVKQKLDTQLDIYLQSLNSQTTQITNERMIQKFNNYTDGAQLQLGNGFMYQINFETTLSYSLFSEIPYKMYLIAIKSIFRIFNEFTEDSLINISFSERHSSSLVINLNQYQLGEQYTMRSQINQLEGHYEIIQPLKVQQEYLNSEAHLQSLHQSSDKSMHSQEQQNNKIYMSSLSSDNSSQSDVQRVLTKAHIYSEFTQMKKIPQIVKFLLSLNIISYLVIICLTLAYIFVYVDWQSNTSNNLQILEAFTMTHYARATLQGSVKLIYELQQLNYLDEYTTSFDYENNSLYQNLVQIQNQNIQLFLDSMDQYLQNIIIQEVFSTTNLSQINIISNNVESVNGWTALYQLLDIINNLKTYNTLNGYGNSLLYLLQSYTQYSTAYALLQSKFSNKIQHILIQQNKNTNNILYTVIGLYLIFFGCSMLLHHSYFQLIKKYLRCCEQISHHSIEEEIKYVQDLSHTYVDIYEMRFTIKDKFQLDDKHRKSVHHDNIQQAKFMQINDSRSIRQFYFLFSLLGKSIFLIFYIIIRSYNMGLVDQIQNNIEIYQKGISLAEALAETCQTSYACQISPILISAKVLNRTLVDQYNVYTNQSYQLTNRLFSELLSTQGIYGTAMQQLYNSSICSLVGNQQKVCSSIDNGALTNGMRIPLANILTIVQENIILYNTTTPLAPFLLVNILEQNFILDALQSYIDGIRTNIEDIIATQNQNNLIYWVLFQIIITIISITIIVQLHKNLINRLRNIRQFIYHLPPRSLYIEDSFYKTLTYMQKIEGRLIHL